VPTTFTSSVSLGCASQYGMKWIAARWNTTAAGPRRRPRGRDRVGDVAADEAEARVAQVRPEALERPARQVVDDDHVVIVGQEPRHQMMPHEPRSPHHQHRSPHRHVPLATSS
jgi:hypothetical protein